MNHMPNLKAKILEDLRIALRGKKETELSVLRMVLTAIANKEIEKRTRIWKLKPAWPAQEIHKEGELNDEELIEVISSEVKKRRESIVLFEQGKRDDLAAKEKTESEVLQKYLPEQLSEEEIKRLVKGAIIKVGAKEIKDMGKVMAELMPSTKGKADGSLVSKIVRNSLI